MHARAHAIRICVVHTYMHTGFELAHPCYCIVSKHMDARASTHTRIYIYTQHAHAHNVCTHTPTTRTSAPEQHETAPCAASAAAVAAAGCMLACCCCCRWHAGMLQLLLLLHALEGDWPPSHHHFSKHPEQSNPEEHFQRGFLLPVPPPLFSSCPGLLYSIIEFSPGSPECNIYFITGVPEPGVSDH